MTKRVLDVGNCAADHAAIRRLLERHFQAAVHAADTADEAAAALDRQSYDLVLVNRVLDLDGSDGLELIRRLRGCPQHADLPLMLVSNYASYQQQAVAAGAWVGFGKSDLGSPATLERLAEVLADTRQV